MIELTEGGFSLLFSLLLQKFFALQKISSAVLPCPHLHICQCHLCITFIVHPHYLADYCDIISGHVRAMETGYPKAVLEQRLDKIQQIRVKLEESIRYSRDRQIEKCMKRRSKKESDIGEDALHVVPEALHTFVKFLRQIHGLFLYCFLCFGMQPALRKFDRMLESLPQEAWLQ